MSLTCGSAPLATAGGALRCVPPGRAGHAGRMPLLTIAPEECPRGHRLAPGRVLVGWQTCLCLSAEQSGRRGHHTHTCEARHEEGYRTISYDPPHVVAVR